MRGSRTKNEDKAKVIAEKIKSPDVTLKELEKKTGVNYETARKVIDKELPEVVKSSEIIGQIIENDLKTVRNMSEVAMIYSESVLGKAKEDISTIERQDIIAANTVTSDSFKRSQLLTGQPTERLGIGDILSEIQGLK